eukprot:COSAG03_NODE_30053_length_170_cov_8.204461_1_plen_36_part_01
MVQTTTDDGLCIFSALVRSPCVMADGKMAAETMAPL